MNSTAKDARGSTYNLRTARDMLRKLEWEIGELERSLRSDQEGYVALNLAWTAFHILDWIAADLSDQKAWPSAIKELQLKVTDDVGPKKKRQALQEFARCQSVSMAIMEQIALASKHRNLTQYDEKISTTKAALPAVAVFLDGDTPNLEYEVMVHYVEIDFVGADGIPTSEARSNTMAAAEAHDWLIKLLERLRL